MTRLLGPLVAGVGCLREQELGNVIPESPLEGPAGNQARVETPRFQEEVGPSGDEAGRRGSRMRGSKRVW